MLNNMRMNFGNRWEIVCLLRRLAEGMWPWKLEQIYADTKETS